MKTIVAGCVVLLGCSSSTSGVPAGATDSGTSETAALVDSAIDTATQDDDGVVDTGTVTDTAPSAKAYVRIFDGMDGAEIYVCEDGKRLGGTYNRIGSGGAIASGYIATTAFGSHKVHAQASTAASCLSASSGDPSYSLSAGNVKTLFVRGITGLTGIVAVTDDLTAPASGKARVRVYNGASALTTTHSGLDVCVSGAPWAAGISALSASAYQEVTPGAMSVEIRAAATGACGGTVLGTISITPVANATHTLFLVDGRGTDARDHASFCTDANAGIPTTTASCSDTAF